MPFGVMGGQYQATGHVHILAQLIDRGDDQQAPTGRAASPSAAPCRWSRPSSTRVRDDLERRGHRIVVADEPLGGCQAIWIDHEDGVMHGGSDHRKDGIALGYSAGARGRFRVGSLANEPCPPAIRTAIDTHAAAGRR